MMIIYKTTNLIDGKIYIGYDTRDNHNYYGSGVRFCRALKKYGKENFKKVAIDHSSDFNELCLKEKFWINFYNARNRDVGYNTSEGGLGNKGWIPSEETRRKIGIKSASRKHSEETKLKIAEKVRNNKERAEKISKALSGKKKTEAHKRGISLSVKHNLAKVK